MPDERFEEDERRHLRARVRRYALILGVIALVLAVWGVGEPHADPFGSA